MGKADFENSENEADFLERRDRRTSGRSIQERVAQFYYFLGLFCSTYSIIIITAAISLVLISCYPLLSLPLPGNRPQYFSTPYENYTPPTSVGPPNGETSANFGENLPRWYKETPATVFVQQIVIKSSVFPWSDSLILTDAFRGPLAESFRFLDTLKKIRPSNESAGLPELCFHVGEVKSKAVKGKYSILPEYNCLILSPASFWQGSVLKFQEDPDILSTILNYRSHQKGKSGLAELLLGMNVKETGLKRYPFRSRQRIVSYAVTIIFQRFDPEFTNHLRSSITKLYPSRVSEELSPGYGRPNEQEKTNGSAKSSKSLFDAESQTIVHIFYPSQSSLLELIPLVCTYVAMFVYVYFSVKKVEMIKSKLGVAFSAVLTVVASLCMSVGLCSHFGMSNEINAKTIFPYLIVVIGLENILVLTRSVVSTASHLDVKIRVAQGLSKEGWSITKNLLAEVTLLTIGFFTFIPRIQEFCILTVVALLSDFFLQTVFFATVLSVDIRRTEFATSSKHHSSGYTAPFRTPVYPTKLPRIKSNPRLSNGSLGHKNSVGTVAVVAPSKSSPILVKLPKRVRLVYFWARTRFFQRTFIIFMVGWISFIIYEYGIVAQFNYEADDVAMPMNNLNRTRTPVGLSLSLSPSSRLNSYVVNRTLLTSSAYKESLAAAKTEDSTSTGMKKVLPTLPETSMRDHQNEKLQKELLEPNPRSWRRLSQFHWPVLLGVYNVSLSGKYISVLPPICITIPVDPNVAVALRHPHEHEQAKRFNWQALANAFEPIDFVDEYDSNIPTVTVTPVGNLESLGFFSSWEEGREIPYIPNTPIELALTLGLAIPSLIFITYTLVVFYKCICSRNYAEWRSSWTNKRETSPEYYTEVVFEAVPLVLDGHSEEVECMGSDGNVISSVCLSGVMKIWNATTGDVIVTVNRKRYFEELSCRNEIDDLNLIQCGSDGESVPSGSSPPGPNHNGITTGLPTPPLYNGGYPYDVRPQLLHRAGGGRLSQPQFPTLPFPPQMQMQMQEYTTALVSPVLYPAMNSVVLPPSQSAPFTPTPPLSHSSSQPQIQQYQHRRNCSISSTNSGGGAPPPFQLQKQSSIELNHPIPTHRRTSSFPNQNPGIGIAQYASGHGHSQPIPIPPLETAGIQYGLGHYNSANGGSVTNLESGSIAGSYGNLIRSESRVGSPLEKIREGNFCTGGVEEVPPVWCLDCQENLVILGTGTGRVEIWDSFSGYLKCMYEDNSGAGIMCLKLIGNRLVTARINGTLDFLEVESTLHGQAGDNLSSLSHRWHSGGGGGESGSGESGTSMYSLDSEIRCVWLTTLKAHQQPITCMDSEGGRILTGSQDHCLKVFRLEDHLPFYTLHGHYGPITCLFIDKISPMTSGSGSQDGMLCVWDLLTGLCMYSTQAHDGPISALTYSASYIISAGGDNKICVWERFQGHLLNTIQLNHSYCSSLVMLTHNLLISSKQGSLIVWDVRSGDVVRVVRLGHRDNTVFVRQLMGCADGILCDYGSQLRLVRFPSILSKLD